MVGSALIPEESLIVGAARQLIEDRADVANVAAVVLTADGETFAGVKGRAGHGDPPRRDEPERALTGTWGSPAAIREPPSAGARKEETPPERGFP